MNRTRIAAVFVLGCSLGLAQEANPIRIDHWTESDLKRLDDAQAVVTLAMKAHIQVMKDIRREHGFIEQQEGVCAPYDEVTERHGHVLIVERINPHPDKDGWCRQSDASDEGFETHRYSSQ